MIKITYSNENYKIAVENLSKLLSKSSILKNVFYYEGVESNQNIITIFKNTLYDIELEILEELNIFKFNGIIKVNKEGIIQLQSIKFNSSFYRSPTFRIDCKKIGDLILFENHYYLLSEKQSNLLEELTEFNIDNSKNSSPETQFVTLQKIKNAIDLNELGHNQDIESYNPIFIDELTIDIDPKSSNRVEVKPKLIGDAGKFDEEFNNQYQKKKDIGPTVAVGENTFLILDEEKRDSLKKLRKYKHIEGEENINDFINNVDQILPGFKYSDRVIGWGEYTLPALKMESNNLVWITEVDESGDKKYKIKFITEDNRIIFIPEDYDLEELRESIDNAEAERKDSIILNLENRPIISISDGKKLLYLLRTLKEAKYEESREKSEKRKESSSKEFVIIQTDFEDTEYIEETVLTESSELEIPRIVELCEWNLYEYQKYGLQWLQTLNKNLKEMVKNKSVGGLLADDMGLGKTLQILSFLAWLKEKNKLRKALIIVPMTLINNWSTAGLDFAETIGEIERFFPNIFNPLPIRKASDIGKLNDSVYDLVISSYDTIMAQCKTEERFQRSFGVIDWDFIVCDEAQKIKNPATKRTIAVKSLKGTHKIACTATPIENHMDELWSICDWIIPGKLGSLAAYRKKYIRKSKVQHNDVHDDLANQLKGYYLRRTKEQVLTDSLTKKNIKINLLQASDYQKKVHRELIESYDGKTILPLIGKLIGIMSHPMFLSNSVVNLDTNLLEEGSAKFKWLGNTLRRIKNENEKVIIFTPSKWIQSAIKKYIHETLNINPIIVNGDVKGNIRISEIERVTKKKGFGVLILSPEVAGYGLTITEANHVIHFSRGWNPAKENQATDRAYRIGQLKDVHVYVPIVTWNDIEIEEKIFNSNEDYYEWNYSCDKNSPEENLDHLMRKKGKLLKNFFSVASTISADELFNSFIRGEIKSEKLDFIELLELLTPDEIEAFCALLFEKLGFSTVLTPISGDLGVDVVVYNYSEENHLILQVHKSNYRVKATKIQEIIAAKETYQKALDHKCRVGIFTNSIIEGRSVRKLIKDHCVEVYDFNRIQDIAKELELTYADVANRSNLRKSVVYN
ncbi:SNF2-related protein [Bacteroidota bacterium]